MSTTGTLIGAFNIGGLPSVATTTVNGTTFTGLSFSGPSVTSGNFSFTKPGGFSSINGATNANPSFSLLSAQYRALLSSEAGSGRTSPITLTMSGLTEGATYQFEWWSNDTVDTGAFITTATAGGAVTLLSNTGGASGGLGQFALGTFVADATNVQTIVFSSTGGPSIIDGIQLRQTVVPEPSTWALLSLGLPALLAFRRRNRKA